MNTKEMIAVMAAFDEGKQIQWREADGSPKSDWQDIRSPIWNWQAIHYRVKPEPEYVWGYTYDYGDGKVHTSFYSEKFVRAWEKENNTQMGSGPHFVRKERWIKDPTYNGDTK